MKSDDLKRMPPPPPIAVNDPIFNRWLHDITAFIAEGGGIDTGVIPGYDTMVSTVSLHTTEIASNTSDIALNSSNIATNSSNIATNTTNIATNASNIAANSSNIATNASNIAANTASINTLAARPQVRNGTTAPAAGLGIAGDWFADTSAKHIYVKVGAAWVLIV